MKPNRKKLPRIISGIQEGIVLGGETLLAYQAELFYRDQRESPREAEVLTEAVLKSSRKKSGFRKFLNLFGAARKKATT